MIRVASWGAGLQSTTMIAMSALGELDPLDHVIHCDTGWERTETVAARDWYTEWYREQGLPVTILHTGDIRADAGKPHGHIPFWTDSGGPLRRQCTRHYKIRPSRRFARTLLGLDPTLPPNPEPNSIEQWIGITTDEWTRAKRSDVAYIRNRWPLLERNMAREDCAAWLEDHDLPVPVKSACVICPYRRATEWLEIREQEPEQFDRAVAFDEHHRHLPDMPPNPHHLEADTVYIWRNCEPLATTDFEAAAARERRTYAGQLPLFACESGFCGV